MDVDTNGPAESRGMRARAGAPRAQRRTYELRSLAQRAREAGERQRVLAELAEMLRANPFLAVEV